MRHWPDHENLSTLSSPLAARARGDAGNRRPHDGRSPSTAQEATVIANVAITRELADWCWSIAGFDRPAVVD